MAGKDEQQPKEKEEKKPFFKSKLFFIIIGAAVLVIGVVVGIFAFTGKGGEEGGHKAEAKAEGGGHGGGKGGEKGPSAIYALEPFIVNIYDGQELRYLKVKVEFETTMADPKAELDARQAPIRDAILVLLTTKTLQDVQDLNGKNQLRDEILASVSKIVPPGKVTKVYFTDFVVQ